MAALTGRPFRITRIRAGRRPPGLKAQHLAAVRLAAQLCGATLEGDAIGSTTLSFTPGALRPGAYTMDVGTAGSVTLLLQAVLLPALFAGDAVRLKLIGGTDVRWSPPVDYLSGVLLPYYRMAGTVRESVERRGYYPKGQGMLTLEVRGHGRPLPPLAIRSEARRVRIVSAAAEGLQERQVAERQATAAGEALRDLELPVLATHEYSATPSLGSSIVIWAEGESGEGSWPFRLGSDRLGERGVPAEEVGRRAAQSFRDLFTRSAPVEEHLADNLIPLMALAGGSIECQVVSPHTLANAYVVELFTGKTLSIEGGTITC